MSENNIFNTEENYKIIPKGNGEVEKYMYLYRQYNLICKDDKKVVVLYQVGEFYEIYSLVYPPSEDFPNGKKEGNLWEVQKELDLLFSEKQTTVYKDSNIKVYIGGVPVRSLDKYLKLAVDKNWSVILYSQYKNKNGRFDRKFDEIVSPGLNMLSIQETNNIVIIYLEKVPLLIKRRVMYTKLTWVRK